MKISVKWIVLAFIAYFAFLIQSLPASHVIHRLTLPSNLALSGLSGSIWNGRANLVVVDGLVIENVEWKLSFFSLLLGNAALDINAGNPRDSEQISLTGPISVNLFDSNQFSTQDFVAFAPAFLVFSELPLSIPVDAKGSIKLTINTLDFDQQCAALSGNGQWLNAGVEGLNESIALGSFSADVSCTNGTLTLNIKEPNKLGLTAVANIPPDWQISVEGRFKPDADLPKEVSDAALFFGAPDAQGFYQIDF